MASEDFKKMMEASLIAIPYQDQIYKNFFGQDITIVRNKKTDISDGTFLRLDKILGIDVIIIKNDNTCITVQEKALTEDKQHYNTITFEYYQNRYTKEPGQYFTGRAQYHLAGYIHSDGTFIKWMLVDAKKTIAWQKQLTPVVNPDDYCYVKYAPYGFCSTKDSLASFLWIDIDVIPHEYILAHS